MVEEVRGTGRTLRQARQGAGMTQQQIADMIGIPLWSYNRVENGRQAFNFGWIAHLPPAVRKPVISLYTRHYQREIMALNRLTMPGTGGPPRFVRGTP